ncbi:MAG: response regulator [Longimicrobiales bacterium]
MDSSPSNRSGIARVEAAFPPPAQSSAAAVDREAGHSFLSSAGHDRALDHITHLARTALGATAAVLSCVREGSEYFKSTAGLPAPLAERRGIPLAESLCRGSLLDGIPHAIDAGLGQTSSIAQAFGWKAALAVPARASAALAGVTGEVSRAVAGASPGPIGALWVVTDTARAWSAREQALLEAFAAHAADLAVAGEGLAREEADARDRRARFQALAGSVPHGLWCFAFEEPIPSSLAARDQVDRMFERGQLVESNDVLARLLGAAFAEDLLALPFDELIDRSDENVRTALIEFVRDGYRLDTLGSPAPRGRSGERREFANLAGVVDEGRLTRVWGVLRAPARDAAVGPPDRSLDTIAHLARGFAHEFNNLLTTIRGHTELALRERQDDEDLAEIRRATDRAKRLTRQLLAFSRKPGALSSAMAPDAVAADFEQALRLADAAVDSPAVGEAEAALAAAETILVVEDEDGVRALARRTLLLQGYTVMEAENGQAALDLASGYSGNIHLLLTDVVMPGLSGPQLAQRFRTDRPDTRVVFMSGYAGDTFPAGALARDGFLEKPFTPMALARVVRRTLDRTD